MSKALDIGVELQHQEGDALSSAANLTEYAHGLERELQRQTDETARLEACLGALMGRILKLRRALQGACRELSAHRPIDAPEMPSNEELARAYWAHYSDEKWEG